MIEDENALNEVRYPCVIVIRSPARNCLLADQEAVMKRIQLPNLPRLFDVSYSPERLLLRAAEEETGESKLWNRGGTTRKIGYVRISGFREGSSGSSTGEEEPGRM